jgi:hypothetical protein
MSADELALLREIRDIMAELLALSKSKRAAAPSNIATDADLDSQYGDEKVNFKPRDWTGEWIKGQRMSESQPAMLDMLAETYDYFATKDEMTAEVTSSGKPKAPYTRQSARRARGWAARLRAGWKPKAAEMPSEKEIAW